MDDLDKQLAELQMMADKEKLSHHSGTLGKKIGPAVPPKPKKSTQPQVPQSYSIKQQLEPSYSSSLHTSNTPQYYSNLPITSNTARVPSPNSAPVIQQCQYANIDPPASLHHHSLRSTNSNSGAVNHYSNLPSTGTNNSLRQQQVTVAMSPAAKAQRAVISNSMSSSGAATYGNTGVAPQQAVYSNMGEDRDGVIYSNLARVGSGARGGIYSNVPGSGKTGGYCENDDLPLPPPPVLPLDHKHNILPPPGDYAPCTVNTNFPPPPQDEFPPPPSPVSSSYSELRRATEPNHTDYNYGSQYTGYEQYSNYGGMSQSSSTYESIYEPINPRPPSQLSSRSNYSLYTPYTGTSGQSINTASGQVPVGNSGTNAGSKDQEVDALTDLLVQRMDGDNRDRGQNAGDESNSGEVDVYGVCVKCGEKVIGENSGCTAMEQVYHTSCFTCEHCAINLQGKPFYALEGNPYCKEDYLNTLEKCCVCMNPILDRILRATGKPYHPKCFCCIICGKSLDGIPFTVDATNQIHCIDDFHKKFAPKCCVCNQPIMPEPGQEETVRVVALDRSFHIQCYKCEDCGLVLSSEAEGRGCYPLDNHVLCKSCNAKRVQTLTSHMTTEL